MFLASHSLEPISSDPVKAHQFLQDLLAHGFQTALHREHQAISSKGSYPVSYYARQMWVISRNSRFESTLRHHWKEKVSRPFANDAEAVEEGRTLSRKIRQHTQDDIQSYVRLYYIAINELHPDRPSEFYRGFLDKRFALILPQLEDRAQAMLKQALKHIEIPVNEPAPVAIAVASPPISQQPSLSVDTAQSRKSGTETLHSLLTLLKENEIENDLIETELGEKLASAIEAEARGDKKTFFKLIAIAIKENPRTMHPAARSAFKQRLSKAAENMKTPTTQLDFLRRILTESRDQALDHLEEAGLLSDDHPDW